MEEGREARPMVVALTGGIAAGKTAVAKRFAALGVTVVDTDQIARVLVEPGMPSLQKLRAAFGDSIIGEDQRLRRRALRNLVFSKPEQKVKLDSIMHPAIWAEAERRVRACRAPYCILVIPLLAETGLRRGIDRVLLVKAREELRLERLMERDDLDRGQAMAIVDSQASDAERRAIANDIIVNEASPEDLDEQVAVLHRRYLELAP